MHHLTFDENSNFYPEKPFGQSDKESYFGLANVVPQIKGFASDQDLISALQKHEAYAFAGLENTDILINTKPTKVDCSNGTYQKGSLNYNKFCQATMALAAHNFYPLGVKQDDPKVGAGQWYLPALGELIDLYGYK